VGASGPRAPYDHAGPRARRAARAFALFRLYELSGKASTVASHESHVVGELEARLRPANPLPSHLLGGQIDFRPGQGPGHEILFAPVCQETCGRLPTPVLSACICKLKSPRTAAGPSTLPGRSGPRGPVDVQAAAFVCRSGLPVASNGCGKRAAPVQAKQPSPPLGGPVARARQRSRFDVPPIPGCRSPFE